MPGDDETQNTGGGETPTPTEVKWNVNGATSFNFLGYSVLVAQIKANVPEGKANATTFQTPKGFIPEAILPSVTVSSATIAKTMKTVGQTQVWTGTYTITPTTLAKNAMDALGFTVYKVFVLGHY